MTITTKYLTDHLAACKSELNATKAELEKCRAALRMALEQIPEPYVKGCSDCKFCGHAVWSEPLHASTCEWAKATKAIESCLSEQSK